MELGVRHGGRWPLYRMYALLQRWKHAAIGELLLLRVLSAPPPPPPSGSLLSELLVYVRLRRSALERLRSVRRWQLMYVSQLDLFAEMCCGRSHYCSRAIGKQFPYELLMVGVRDSQLPDIFRASFARLLQNLYVAVFPHAHPRFVGRAV